ncbi:hemolysin family protein [Aquabacterium sp. A7-Y]|uniref:hemolysin family protein n=1 Tax=Aquabacterium sp. A7-Y TaxID=1349605 RepID=UPI00223D0C2D|nr:hemolysin family protein [Aquabacterium sp. A7-Y]MCW7536505.1 hemolysin family protein [Aquabacterium sp. A7-Y]
MEIALLFGLILLNGVFAMSEIALVTSRKSRLQRLVDEGDGAAAAALELGEDPTRFLSTVQIGITSIGVLNGIVGESALAGPLARWLQQAWGIAAETSEVAATALAVVLITYFSIVLGELLPKRIGQLNPEPIARRVAGPMLGLATLARPFVRLLAGSVQLLMKLLRIRDQPSHPVTEEDIRAMLAEGSHAGVIEHHEHQMVRNVFQLDERHITALMVPRSAIEYLDVEEPLELSLRKLEAAEHSRYPVCEGGLARVLGFANARQLLAQTLRGEQPRLTLDMQPAVYVPETLTGMELLDNFRSTNTHFALVIDEYGEVQGLVTLQDVLEAITGEFKPHRAEDAWAVQREDGSWLVDGLIPNHELKERLGLDQLPEEQRGRYNTLSGMLMLLQGKLPQTGDVVHWQDWTFEIVDMDNKRIDKVLARRTPDETPVSLTAAEE